MIFQHSVSGIISCIVLVFVELLFQLPDFWQYSIISKSVKYVTLLYIIVTYIQKIQLQNYKNHTAHPENSGQAINQPCYFWKNLLAQVIYPLQAKYSLKGLVLLIGLFHFKSRHLYRSLFSMECFACLKITWLLSQHKKFTRKKITHSNPTQILFAIK